MSRENFAVKLTLTADKEDKNQAARHVYLVVHNIDALIRDGGHTMVIMSSGAKYLVNESPEEIERKAGAYGILKILS